MLANSCFLFCGPALGVGRSFRQPDKGGPHRVLAGKEVGWEGKEGDGGEWEAAVLVVSALRNGRKALSWLLRCTRVTESEITGIVGTVSIQKEFVDPWPMPPGAESLLVT